jgi:LuxR family maltose regulon positive regulatory protein
LSVAQQLFAANQPGQGWVRAWLIRTAPRLTTRAPQLAADLLRRELDETPSGDGAWEGLTASLARALLAVGSYDEAAQQARAALPMMADLVRRAETYSALARAQVSAGRSDEAIATIRQGLAADLPRTWQARMLALLAMLQRADTGELDTADVTARQALSVAEEAGDAFATAHALAGLWLSHGVRRDHAAALDYVDRALRVLGDDPGYADLRSFAVDGRIFTLQNLDRRPEAEVTLRQARESAQRAGLALPVLRIPDRENRDFLVAAHAMALEQRGETHRAVQVLGAIVPRRDGEMTLTHQWLPDLVRLAIATGDQQVARTAAQACQAEAAAETQPARAAAASLRCQGLLESDPVPIRDAVAHYRTIGPAAELPAAVSLRALSGVISSGDKPGTLDVPAAPPVRGGVVSRCALFGRLAEAERVVQISAPAGSGKTVLMRSWIAEAGLATRAAWVSVDSEDRDPQGFWISVAGALRATTAGSALVRPLTAAPDLDGWAVVERLLTDLAPLEERLWLVIDDAHLLASAEVLPQLELLLLRAPQELRFVLGTRHDLWLGLHRLRLEGELTEIRAADLRFSLAEARALFGATGVEVPAGALARLHGRTEGWAAGLRLAALSLAGHPDPERFAAEFSGTDRTVAEFLLAEVLDRQSEAVRRLLLRTSVLERVCGPLADVLTGSSGGERILQDLEQAGAFVVSLDAGRSWFRYHQLFADLLQLELRRAEPHERAALHATAAGWLAGHGHPVEAVRQAQAAGDWGMAARLLSDHWLDLYLGGRGATLAGLLARIPRQVVAASPELTAVQVAGDLVRGALDDAGRHLAQATGALAAVPAERRGRVQVMLAVLRLFLARRLADFPVVAEEAQRLLALTEAADAAHLGPVEDLRAAAFISLGLAEIWAFRFEDAERHVQQGVALARLIGRPYLELHGLAHGAHGMLLFRPGGSQAEWSTQAIALAERHGWGEESLAGMAYAQLGIGKLYQGRLDEAEPWLERAERTLRTEVEPAAGMSLRYVRAVLEVARGRCQEALAAFRGAEKLAATLVRPHPLATSMRSRMLQTLVRLGQTGRAGQALAELGQDERASAEMRTAVAALRLAAGDPQAAADALAPVLDGSLSGVRRVRMVTALLLEARARDALGDRAAAGRVLERALDITKSDGIVLPFLLDPVPALLERHRRSGTAHRALISQILNLPAGSPPIGGPGGYGGPGSPSQTPLTDSETRVLRYLPTHLTAHEIANELFLSVNTVSTHTRHLYAKLGVHSRHGAVDRARALGLLAPSTRRA